MIHYQYDLRHHNTFGLSACAEQFAVIRTASDLPLLLEAAGHPAQVRILGGGSNVLLPPTLPGLTLLNQQTGITAEYLDDEYVSVTAASGENWHHLVLWSIRQGFSGLENMALIPGTVGAAPIQNIGAYGVEIKDVFTSVEAVALATGDVRQFSSEDCHFGYRDSIFKEKSVEGKFYLSKIKLRLRHRNHILKTDYGDIRTRLQAALGDSPPTPADVAAAVIEIRRSKLPDWRTWGNAGSFFKNPVVSQAQYEALKPAYPHLPAYPADSGAVKIPAGWLIEQCGWKGKRMGQVGCYEKQALVIVNYGGATGDAILAFSEAIIGDVLDKFGIVLEREVRYVV